MMGPRQVLHSGATLLTSMGEAVSGRQSTPKAPENHNCSMLQSRVAVQRERRTLHLLQMLPKALV